MYVQPLQPGQLIVKLWSGLRVSVGSIDAGNERAVDRGFDITALVISHVTGKFPAGDNHLGPSGENCDAVPLLLPDPDGGVASLAQRHLRKVCLDSLQFLQTYDIRLRGSEPAQQIWQSFVNVVDVEGGDLQSNFLRRARSKSLL